MIEIYNGKGPGRTKVFFVTSKDEVTSVIIGNQSVSTGQGFQFYVDDYVANQIDKCELVMDGLKPTLQVKDGEEIEVPELSEKELAIRQKEWELEQLRNSED